ncbi:hypothetical protein ACQP00_11735 [Dactylosporangium sp. CS-047395]|uniref:hypothetical protein n=1 Tax=Dactylosporangium sp. CS-047395 TaxID=3239936 RepID=UPI003D91D85B
MTRLKYLLATGLLGIAALVPLGFVVVFVLRGVLYGVVDPGPYDHSWGGPSRAGAWAVHFLVGIPVLGVGLGGLWGLRALHRRLRAARNGERAPWWLLPAVGAVALAVAGFLVAWSRQL